MSKRVDQKQAARVVRDQLKRERRQQRALWGGAVAAAILVVAVLIGWAVYSTQDGGDYTAPPGVASDDDSGIKIGSGPVKIDIYADFICPACQSYETATKSIMDQAIKDNKVTLIFHPVAFLDPQSTTKYSSRSSNASACAAEGGKFQEYTEVLFANQPPEGGAGLSDDELIRLASEAGLSGSSFSECVKDRKYRGWVTHVSDKASERGVTGTPTIYVNDKEIGRTPQDLTNALASAGK